MSKFLVRLAMLKDTAREMAREVRKNGDERSIEELVQHFVKDIEAQALRDQGIIQMPVPRPIERFARLTARQARRHISGRSVEIGDPMTGKEDEIRKFVHSEPEKMQLSSGKLTDREVAARLKILEDQGSDRTHTWIAEQGFTTKEFAEYSIGDDRAEFALLLSGEFLDEGKEVITQTLH